MSAGSAGPIFQKEFLYSRHTYIPEGIFLEHNEKKNHVVIENFT